MFVFCLVARFDKRGEKKAAEADWEKQEQTEAVRFHIRVLRPTLYKHEYFICHKTFPLLEQRLAPFIQADHLKSNYQSIKS